MSVIEAAVSALALCSHTLAWLMVTNTTPQPWSPHPPVTPTGFRPTSPVPARPRPTSPAPARPDNPFLRPHFTVHMDSGTPAQSSGPFRLNGLGLFSDAIAMSMARLATQADNPGPSAGPASVGPRPSGLAADGAAAHDAAPGAAPAATVDAATAAEAAETAEALLLIQNCRRLQQPPPEQQYESQYQDAQPRDASFHNDPDDDGEGPETVSDSAGTAAAGAAAAEESPTLREGPTFISSQLTFEGTAPTN